MIIVKLGDKNFLFSHLSKFQFIVRELFCMVLYLFAMYLNYKYLGNTWYFGIVLLVLIFMSMSIIYKIREISMKEFFKLMNKSIDEYNKEIDKKRMRDKVMKDILKKKENGKSRSK